VKTEEQIEEEASYWLIEMDEEELPPAQQAEFDKWCEESPRHRNIFEIMRTAWKGSCVLEGQPMTPRRRF
jgi:ferric-dicitrate binding protein FerR (iron transport regulator)